MNVQEAVRGQLQFWHGTLEQSLADCPPEVLHARPPGSTTNSIAAIYAHAVISEDYLVHTRLQEGTTLFDTGGWSERLGIASPGAPRMTDEWGAGVRMDFDAFKEYSAAVYAATDAHLASMSDADFDRPLPSATGDRPTPAGFLVVQVMATHFPAHAGEVAALLGVAGRKGLPF